MSIEFATGESASGIWWGRPWTEVLTALGTTGLAVLAFVVVIVAVLGRGRERRRVKGHAAHERSQQAAERLAKTIFDHWRIVTLAPPGSQVDLTDFLMAVSASQPALDDAVLATRVDGLTHAFVELTGYVNLAPVAVVHRDGSYSADVQREVGEWYRTRLDYTQALARRTTWVGQSLAAHQVDRALPAEDGLSALPVLGQDISE
jgi:hypothetical protein